MLRQLLGNLVPDHVGLRVSVQQQQARAAAAEAVGDVDTVDVALVFAESGKHRADPCSGAGGCILKVLALGARVEAWCGGS
jgi:hypothetical protein